MSDAKSTDSKEAAKLLCRHGFHQWRAAGEEIRESDGKTLCLYKCDLCGKKKSILKKDE